MTSAPMSLSRRVGGTMRPVVECKMPAPESGPTRGGCPVWERKENFRGENEPK